MFQDYKTCGSMSASFWKYLLSQGMIVDKTAAPHLSASPTKTQEGLLCEGSQSVIRTSAPQNYSSDCSNAFDALIPQKCESERQSTGDAAADIEHQAATLNAAVNDLNTRSLQAAINISSNDGKGYLSSMFDHKNAIRSDYKNSEYIAEKHFVKKSRDLTRPQVLQPAVTETPANADFKKDRFVWSLSGLSCDDKIGGTNPLRAIKFPEPSALFELGCSTGDLYQNSLKFTVLKSDDAKWIPRKEISELQQSGHEGIKQERQSISCRALPVVEQADMQTVSHKVLPAQRVQDHQVFMQKVPEFSDASSLAGLKQLISSTAPQKGRKSRSMTVKKETDLKSLSASATSVSNQMSNVCAPANMLNKCVTAVSVPQQLPNGMWVAFEGDKILYSVPSQTQQVLCSVPLQHKNNMTAAVSHNQLGTVQHELGRSSSVQAESLQDTEFQTTQQQKCRTQSPHDTALFPVATSTPVSKRCRTRSTLETNGTQTDSGIALSFSSRSISLSRSSERDAGMTSNLKPNLEKSGHVVTSHADTSNDNDIQNLTPEDSTDGGDSLNTSLSSMHWLKDFALKPKNSALTEEQIQSAPVRFTQASSTRGKSGSHRKQPKSDSEKSKRPPHTFGNLIKFALATRPLRGMKVKEICKWIEDKFPYYKHKANSGWKNSIRQNLSMYSCFVKVSDPFSSKKSGSYWICKPDQPKSCTETSTHLSGSMPVMAMPPDLQPYTLVCLPNASWAAPLPGQMPCYISVPASSSVGLPSSTGTTFPIHSSEVPGVLPIPKLPIPKLSTAHLPPVYKNRTRAGTTKTRARKAATTRITRAGGCKNSSKLKDGTDLVFKAWMQTQADKGKATARDYFNTLSMPFQTTLEAQPQNDVGQTARKRGTNRCFSETVARSLDFCLSSSKGNSESSSQFKVPVSEEEKSTGFQIMSLEEDMLSKSRNRRKQVYPKHRLANDTTGITLDSETVLTKDTIPDDTASQAFTTENSDRRMPLRKKQKVVLPLSPLLSARRIEFMRLPHMPSVNPLDSKFDLAQHNILDSSAESPSKLPETSTPIRQGQALAPQHPQSSPISEVLPQPLTGGLSPVNSSSFFETMGDLFVSGSPSAHLSTPVSDFNPAKGNSQNGKNAESMADGSNGHLPELTTPPSRWSWVGRHQPGILSTSVGHWGYSKDEMHPGQNLSHIFEGSNLMDMYEVPSFNLSPQHFHFQSGSPYNTNKTPAQLQPTMLQQTGCSDPKLLVHSLDLTDFQHQNVGHNLGSHMLQPEAGRSTLDVARRLCYASSSQFSTQNADLEANSCVPTQVLSTNYQSQNMNHDLEQHPLQTEPSVSSVNTEKPYYTSPNHCNMEELTLNSRDGSNSLQKNADNTVFATGHAISTSQHSQAMATMAGNGQRNNYDQTFCHGMFAMQNQLLSQGEIMYGNVHPHHIVQGQQHQGGAAFGHSEHKHSDMRNFGGLCDLQSAQEQQCMQVAPPSIGSVLFDMAQIPDNVLPEQHSGYGDQRQPAEQHLQLLSAEGRW